MKPEIKIPLPNGYYLCAEQSTNPNYPCELYVGLMSPDGVWWQDLVVVQNAMRTSIVSKKDPEYIKNRYTVTVWRDCDNEDYTDQFYIDQHIEEEWPEW